MSAVTWIDNLAEARERAATEDHPLLSFFWAPG